MPRSRTTPFQISTLVAFLVIGCGGGGGSDTEASTNVGQLSGSCSSRIFEGTTCPNAKGPIAAVVGFNANGRVRTLCSGTFLSSKHVLTAAHCLPSSTGENALLTGLAVALDEKTFSAPVSYVAHPKYSSAPKNQLNPFDVAILTLTEEAPVATLPIILSGGISVGQDAALYGYGDDQTNLSAIERGTPLTQPKRADVVLRARDSGVILFGSTTAGACSGDSGGPAVALSSSGDVGVIGVASTVIGSTCSSATIAIDDLGQLLGGISEELRAQLLQAFPDGMIPRNSYVDVESSDVSEFIAREAPDAEFR